MYGSPNSVKILVMSLPVRALAIGVWLAVSVAGAASGKAPDRTAAQAQVLDHAEFLCDNCFFGASDYYFCFAVDNAIMVAYQSIPVINWEDKSKNYLTKAHRAWTPWTPGGATVPISYDEKHIWVSRTDGKKVKQVKLHRSSLRDIFANSVQCRQSGGAKTQ